MTNNKSQKVTPSPLEEVAKEQAATKVGKFIVVNTPTIKGIRLNLEKVRTYAKAGPTANSVQVAWDNGTASAYTFADEQEAAEFLHFLDSYCL